MSSLPGGLQSKGAALLQRKTAPACLAQRGTAILTSRLLRHGGTSTAHSLSIQLLSSQLSSCRVAAPSPLLRKASASAAPGNIDAATATPPAAAIELDRSNPLVVALENAQGKQAEACQVSALHPFHASAVRFLGLWTVCLAQCMPVLGHACCFGPGL